MVRINHFSIRYAPATLRNMRASAVVTTDSVRLHLEETGIRRGRPVLFIHGFSHCSSCWRKQLHSDLASSLRLVALDLRGHGRSDRPSAGYSDSTIWAADIATAIETLNLDAPVLVGWSYGGLVICDYLRQYGESKIAGIIFVSAVTQIGTPQALAVTPPHPGRRKAALLVGRRMLRGRWPTRASFYHPLGCRVKLPPEVRHGMFARRVDNDDVLARLSRPVLLIHGREDPAVLPEAAERHAAIVKQARTSLYPRVGHYPFWERPHRFNQELLAFVRELPDG